MLLRNLYDSHSHVVSTGQLERQWSLSEFSSLTDLRPESAPSWRRGEWLLGFGWDENRLKEGRCWSLAQLDGLFPEMPIYFSRCDGHAGIINSAGLRWLARHGLMTADLSSIHGGTFGEAFAGSGDLLATENSHFRILQSIPAPDGQEIREAILAACARFNREGYTHVRDMEGNADFFRAALELEAEGRQTMQIDWNFVCERLEDVEKVLRELQEMRSRQSRCNRIAGFKFYMDGSLGSRTALLSRPYADQPEAGPELICWVPEDVEKMIETVWRAGFAVACHTIGDEAVDIVVEIARQVSARGIAGHLHLEHVEILRDETIQKMKPLHVRCHLQPCHWLSDRIWLKERVGFLHRYAFPWAALRRAKIPMSFGHDSPIEPPVIASTLRALRESAEAGIPALGEDPWRFMSHPDFDAVPGETLFEDDQVLEVRFDGKVVFTAR